MNEIRQQQKENEQKILQDKEKIIKEKEKKKRTSASVERPAEKKHKASTPNSTFDAELWSKYTQKQSSSTPTDSITNAAYDFHNNKSIRSSRE